VQPPKGTTHARFVFPKPPFELDGKLTIPFDAAPKPAER
jgi:hypothetical protein